MNGDFGVRRIVEVAQIIVVDGCQRIQLRGSQQIKLCR